jgi:hypothetical protein
MSGRCKGAQRTGKSPQGGFYAQSAADNSRTGWQMKKPKKGKKKHRTGDYWKARKAAKFKALNKSLDAKFNEAMKNDD